MRYKQKESVKWLSTPKDTIYVEMSWEELCRVHSNATKIPKGAIFAIPQDEKLRTFPIGLRLDKHKKLFEEIE